MNAKDFDLKQVLKEAGLEELASGKTFALKAGVLDDATNIRTGMKVAEYAAYNEFGTSSIPSRPFLRNTYAAKGQEWVQNLGMALANRRGIKESLQLVGMRMVDDIVQTIQKGVPPANADATIKRKRKDITGTGGGGTYSPGPLVDTGSLIRSIQYEVAE